MISISRRYEMDAAHRLTHGLPEKHKCRRPHGHRYILTITIEGVPDKHGFLIEYADLDAIVKPIIQMVDHQDLNTLSERCSTTEAADVADNPTVERIIVWMARRMALLSSARQEQGFRLARLHLEESSRSSVTWEPAIADAIAKETGK